MMSLRRFVLGVAAICVAIVGLVLYFVAQPTAPPFRYSARIYQPERSPICPGDTLAYTLTLSVERPATVVLVRAWWDVSTEGPAEQVPPIPARHQIWTREEVGQTITERVELPVPALPPGDYELRGSRLEFARPELPTSYAVPFSIPSGCAP